MESFWPEELSEIKPFETPKNILDEQNSFLMKLTKGMVYTSTESADPTGFNMDHLDFCYNYNIIGKFLDGYRFNVMTFAHRVDIYPMILDVDEDIANELGIEAYDIQIKDEKDFKKFLKSVFASKKINNVIRSIVSLSK